MGFFNPKHSIDELASNVSKPATPDLLVREPTQMFNFNVPSEKLALFWAQAWKNDHPDATAHSEDDMDDCRWVMTMELAIAAQALEESISLALLTGGGSAAARAICRKVLSDDCDPNLGSKRLTFGAFQPFKPAFNVKNSLLPNV